MLTLFTDYALFFLKTATLIAAIIVVLVVFFTLIAKQRARQEEDQLEIRKLNDKYQAMREALQAELLSKDDFKKQQKEFKKNEKDKLNRKRMYVIRFEGDIRASAVSELREVITAILIEATPKDEIVVCLESSGGVIHGYGLAASQLARIRAHKIPLTVIIDKVAASGGYMMAAVADCIIAAPFAIIGSIGVLAQIPNFHRFLEKHNIDFEQLTAGEFKRTLTVFGKNTAEGREKFLEELQEAHVLFKAFIKEYRPIVDIDKVATGEHWYGTAALDRKLIDALGTSDDYLLTHSQTMDIYEVAYTTPKNLFEKFSHMLSTQVSRFLNAQTKGL